MLYRAILVFLLIVAVVLTVNERLQEQWSINRAAQLDQSPAGSPSRVGSGSNVNPATGTGGSYPVPNTPSTEIMSTPRSDPYPINANAVFPAAGPISVVPPAPFQEHNVRVLRAMDLLALPERAAPTVDPPLRVTVGQTVRAVDQRTGWYQVDVSSRLGWAPVDAFSEP